MFRGMEATILIEAMSEIEYIDGLFYVTDNFENGAKLRRCYPPRVFLTSMAGANSAVAQFLAEQRAERDVVVEFERVYPEHKIA